MNLMNISNWIIRYTSLMGISTWILQQLSPDGNFHRRISWGGRGGGRPPSILAYYLLGQKMEDFHN